MTERARRELPDGDRRRSAVSYRGVPTLLLGMAVLVAAYFYLFGVQTGRFGSPFGLRSVALESGNPALRGLELPISELSEKDVKQMARQREVVNQLARRYVGTELRGDSFEDLRVLQEIVDQNVLEADQVYELQALGVALGDVMAVQLELNWVVIEDELSRSRALRIDGTDDLIFPVTMISKRAERDMPFRVRDLYDETQRTVEGVRSRRSRRL